MISKPCPWAFGLVLIASLVACTPAPSSAISLTGSGNVITREEDFTNFDRVAARHSFNVDIPQE